MGCWAHCRRNFYDAKESDPTRAHLVLARIRQLYQVEADAKKIISERELSGTDADSVRQELRQTQALVVVTSLCQWLKEERILPARVQNVIAGADRSAGRGAR